METTSKSSPLIPSSSPFSHRYHQYNTHLQAPHPIPSTMSSNLALLTQSHNIVASKKRQKREQIKEIAFDESARL